MLRKRINNYKSTETEKEALLRHVFENNKEEIETLINNNQDLLYEAYRTSWGFHTMPILHIACLNENNNIKASTIETLILCGANADYKSEDRKGYAPLHCAISGGNIENLQLLVNYVNNINITTNGGETALILLLRYFCNNSRKLEEWINILLKKEIDINIHDEDNMSAIYYAAYYEQYNIVKFLLAECKDIDIDIYSSEERKNSFLVIDAWNIGFDTARTLILKLGISTINIPNKYFDSLDDVGKLKHYLHAGDEEGFIHFASSIPSIDDKDEPKTLIQLACEYNLLSVLKYLVKRGININSVSERCHYRPIELAITQGNVGVLIYLLDQVPTVEKNIIFKDITSFNTYNYNSAYFKCIEILLERCSHSLDVNENFHAYDHSIPVFHEEYNDIPLSHFGRNSNIARLLLKNGASLANKGRHYKLAISNINYEILIEHFNNCIEEKTSNDETYEFSYKYNYKTLFPTFSVETKLNKSPKSNIQPKPELEAVFYMSKSNELKNLLKHPLISSFLYFKWYQVQWIFYINLLFYFLYCIILLIHIGTSTNKEFGLTSIFLILTTIILLLKELLQIWMLPRSYFTNFENYVEIALVATVLFVLFSDYNTEKNKQIYAVIILLAALELLFILGNLPSLSTYILMLRVVSQVSLNFFKFLSFYSILLFAFAFSFHMLLNDDNYVTIFGSQPEDTKTINFFGNYASSIFKTIVMLSGELDTSNMLFDKYPITSHLMFLVFVITIPIILLNLLNGLAISDTQNIRNEAELFALIARVEYLKYVESMIFGNIRCFSCYPLRWAQRALYRKCSLQNLLKTDLSYKIKEGNKKCSIWRSIPWVHFATKIEMIIFNIKSAIKTKNISFDKKIVEETKRVIKQRKEEQNSCTNVQNEDNFKEIKNYLDKQDGRLIDIEKYLDTQNKKIIEIGSRLDAQDKRLLQIQEQIVDKLEILEKCIIEVPSRIQDKS